MTFETANNNIALRYLSIYDVFERVYIIYSKTSGRKERGGGIVGPGKPLPPPLEFDTADDSRKHADVHLVILLSNKINCIRPSSPAVSLSRGINQHIVRSSINIIL